VPSVSGFLRIWDIHMIWRHILMGAGTRPTRHQGLSQIINIISSSSGTWSHVPYMLYVCRIYGGREGKEVSSDVQAAGSSWFTH
jgi:hypothetical protein